MIKTYFLTALRNMLRQRFYALLNILGLATGLMAFLLLTFYIQDELSYDHFLPNSSRIYRITQSNIWEADQERLDALGPAAARAIQEALPEVEAVTRVHTNGDWLVSHTTPSGKVSYDEKRIFAADSNFFEVLGFELLEGDPKTVLQKPNSLVMTQSTARRYFGAEPPLGKMLEIENETYTEVFQVTGLMQDLPNQSHMQFDMLSSIYSYPQVKRMEWSWIWTTFVTYARVKPQTDLDQFAQKLAILPETYASPTIERIFGYSFEEFVKEKREWKLYPQALSKIYLHSSQTGNRLGSLSDIQYIYIFGVIAGLILLLSCINFMNLATARSVYRSKEIGIRKILGSSRRHLIGQFLGESLLYTLIAFLLCLVLMSMLVPWFNQWTLKNLHLSEFLEPRWVLRITALILFTALLAGSYPALFLSAQSPIHGLKRKALEGAAGVRLRNGLVIFQFTISCLLIICTLLVGQQLHYMQTKKLGFAKEQLLVIPKVERLGTQEDAYLDQVRQIPAVLEAEISDANFPEVYNQDYFKPDDKNGQEIPLNCINGGPQYLETLGLEVLAGRDFDKKYGSQDNQVILNETAIKRLGWTQENAIGRTLWYPGNEFKVIGVMPDFHFSSARFEIGPLALFYRGGEWYHFGNWHLIVRLAPGAVNKTAATIQDMESTWKSMSPSIPFTYQFMDQLYQVSYQREKRARVLLQSFTLIAMLIAGLGLLGLASFTVEKRSREIGVRRVLGANSFEIFQLISQKYALMVLISLAIASPIAYWGISVWLRDFAYRIPINAQSFIVGGLIALFTALLAIGVQSWKATRIQPMEVLRDE